MFSIRTKGVDQAHRNILGKQGMMHVLADTNTPAVNSALSTEQMRRLYRQESEDGRKRTTRHGLWVAVFAYIAYSGTDYLFVPDVAPNTIAGRLIVGICSLCMLELLLRLRASGPQPTSWTRLLLYLCWRGTSYGS